MFWLWIRESQAPGISRGCYLLSWGLHRPLAPTGQGYFNTCFQDRPKGPKETEAGWVQYSQPSCPRGKTFQPREQKVWCPFRDPTKHSSALNVCKAIQSSQFH